LSEAPPHLYDAGCESWNSRIKELLQYREENGHCLVPTKYPPNRALGVWVSTQRSQYKRFKEGKKPMLTGRRIMGLNAVGFVWELTVRTDLANCNM
jgi:hypothetical protein